MWDLDNTLKKSWFYSNFEILEIPFLIRRLLESALGPSFIAKWLFNNFMSEPVLSNVFLIYLVPFKMVIQIICKNVFTFKLLLFKLLLAVFWFSCVVIWVELWREKRCLLLQSGILQFLLEGQNFLISSFTKQFQHNFSFSTIFSFFLFFFSDKGFDKNCAQEPSLWSSEQKQQFISWDSSWKCSLTQFNVWYDTCDQLIEYL